MTRPRPTHDLVRTAGFTTIELLIVLLLLLALAAIGMPMMANTTADFRLTGDARNLNGAVGLAKMRAASAFSQARVFLDLDSGTYRVDTLSKGSSPSWSATGGSGALSAGVAAGYGSIDAPPPNTQNAIGQAEIGRAHV